MENNPSHTTDLPLESKSKYPLWFWGLIVLLVVLFVIVLLTDPYYKQVPLWGIE